ncbi:hypothetical protein M0R88_05605 [Halorussus gelatinilyticus]|uniref:Uncharacterized protein n=1 Tax=Halorussus gelatinilyticus TaxID=2937524 RepID=A0A8U0ILD4_9EURY|nr:hypothetical protein [Halorussus gelatinilyticus]UPW01578.1 hypothetical protein M0R88_05605 [Halorussus gelatinilyticus]
MAPPRRFDTLLEYKAFEAKLSVVLFVVFGVGTVLAESLGYLSSNDVEFAVYLAALCFGAIVLLLWWAGKYD